MRESMMIIVPEETETFKDFHRTLDSDCSRHGLAIFEFCRQNSIFFPQFQELVQEEIIMVMSGHVLSPNWVMSQFKKP